MVVVVVVVVDDALDIFGVPALSSFDPLPDPLATSSSATVQSSSIAWRRNHRNTMKQLINN